MFLSLVGSTGGVPFITLQDHIISHQIINTHLIRDVTWGVDLFAALSGLGSHLSD